jgi:hypothetical protein
MNQRWERLKFWFTTRRVCMWCETPHWIGGQSVRTAAHGRDVSDRPSAHETRRHVADASVTFPSRYGLVEAPLNGGGGNCTETAPPRKLPSSPSLL